MVTPGCGHLSPSRSPPPRPSGTCARPEAKGQRPNSPHPAPPARPRPPDLCVIPDWLSSVTCPALSISHPAWAIMAPLSMQYLGSKVSGQRSGRVPQVCPAPPPRPAPPSPVVRGAQLGAPGPAHRLQHLLQPVVTWAQVWLWAWPWAWPSSQLCHAPPGVTTPLQV